MLDDGIPTITSTDQLAFESRVRDLYSNVASRSIESAEERSFLLPRQVHAKYLRGGLGDLPGSFSSLDASRPWICYWIVHSLALLELPLPSSPSVEAIIEFLSSCQHSKGGFGGGPYQIPHLATTYAAVSALVTLGGPGALSIIDRAALLSFLLKMCVPADQGGGMTMHEGGEIDIRGCYCALAVCHMLGMDQEKARVAASCSLEHYVAACQSYEGGIGGEPWNEAHGGYTFCGYAALCLAGSQHAVDLGRLQRWAARMQGWMEGGFMGRTHKLVDGCYSLWQGGLFPLFQNINEMKGPDSDSIPDLLGSMTFSNAARKDDAVAAANAVATELIDELLRFESGVEGDNEDNDMLRNLLNMEACGPHDAALSMMEQAQQALDAALEESLAQESALEAAAALGPDGHELEAIKRSVLDALEKADAAQNALESAKQHSESASLAASSSLLRLADHGVENKGGLLYDACALQLWLLVCCQIPKGGFRDKPGKHADYYHTCYCLSGLSSSQSASGVVLGGNRNKLAETDPLCNVVSVRVGESRTYFASGL